MDTPQALLSRAVSPPGAALPPTDFSQGEGLAVCCWPQDPGSLGCDVTLPACSLGHGPGTCGCQVRPCALPQSLAGASRGLRAGPAHCRHPGGSPRPGSGGHTHWAPGPPCPAPRSGLGRLPSPPPPVSLTGGAPGPAGPQRGARAPSPPAGMLRSLFPGASALPGALRPRREAAGPDPVTAAIRPRRPARPRGAHPHVVLPPFRVHPRSP